MAGMVADMTPNKARLANAAGAAFSTATDLADWLVMKLNMPFRDAHHVTGAIVAMAEKQGTTLDALPLRDMQSVEPRITDDIFNVTAPQNVRKQVSRWQEILERVENHS